MRNPDIYAPHQPRPHNRLGDLRWCITNLGGHRLPYGKTRSLGLRQVLYELAELFNEDAVQYDKAYRSLRKLGAYVQVLTLPAALGFSQPQLVVLTIAPAVER